MDTNTTQQDRWLDFYHFSKVVSNLLKIPTWYVPSEEEIYRYAEYITETQGDVARTLFFIRLDCSTCCDGCFLCVDKICTERWCRLHRRE